MSCKITKKCTICDRLSHFFLSALSGVCPAQREYGIGESDGHKKNRGASHDEPLKTLKN